MCGSLFLAMPADGAVILTITDQTGDPTSVDVDPNVPSSHFFAVDVYLTFTPNPPGITGLTYLFETSLLADSGLFQFTTRNTTGGLFTGSNLTVPDSTVLQPSNSLLDRRNNNDLGGTVADPLTECIQPGTYFLATYMFEAKPAISSRTFADFQTALVSVTGCGPDFDEIPVAPVSYRVNVVPEPGVGMLLCLAGSLLGLSRRKRIV